MSPPVAPAVRKRTSVFNSYAVCLCIASSSDYIPHPVFLEQVKWYPVSNTNNILCYKNKVEADGLPIPANLVIVGLVSSDRPHLGDLGNWNSALNMKLPDIKQQFTLKRPTGFEHFEDDFDIAIHRLKILQDMIAEKGAQQLWFILKDGTLRMSHRLFHEKLEIPDESSDMEDEDIELIKEACAEAKGRDLASREYAIKDGDMREPVNKLLEDYDLIPLEAYSRTNTLIPAKDLSRTLKGALVQVIFSFHSNYVAFQKANNFKGQIVQVKVLKNSTNIPLSPKRNGPIPLQSVQLREDQGEVVNKFLFPREALRDRSVTVKDEPGNGIRKGAEGVSSSSSKGPEI